MKNRIVIPYNSLQRVHWVHLEFERLPRGLKHQKEQGSPHTQAGNPHCGGFSDSRPP